MRPCKFTFDDEKIWDGFAEGGTWNGFDNVAVTKETLDAIIAEARSVGNTNEDDGFEDIPQMENGLYSLGGGYATQIIS